MPVISGHTEAPKSVVTDKPDTSDVYSLDTSGFPNGRRSGDSTDTFVFGNLGSDTTLDDVDLASLDYLRGPIEPIGSGASFGTPSETVIDDGTAPDTTSIITHEFEYVMF